mgnify:CR=1 FL=1
MGREGMGGCPYVHGLLMSYRFIDCASDRCPTNQYS